MEAKTPLLYIRAVADRQIPTNVHKLDLPPIIDLSCENRSLTLLRIYDACSKFGAFQVVNHGVWRDVREPMLGLARGFFYLPLEEKMKFCSDRAPEWPSDSTSFSSLVTCYNKVKQLGLFLEELMSESLGFDKEYISNVLGVQGQHLCMNYYPKALAPELSYGLPVHTDPNVLTIFLHDHSAPELHIFKDDKWFKFNPRPDSLVICIGDRLQALSGGRYRSPFHRTVVKADKSRISVEFFLCQNEPGRNRSLMAFEWPS